MAAKVTMKRSLIVNKDQCRLFENCEAPLCPLDKDCLEHRLWYPDEEICRARKFQSLPWLKKEKRIAKLGLTVDDGFFTVQMLEAVERLTKGLRGANPDNWNSELKWFKDRGLDSPALIKKGGANKASKRKKVKIPAM